MGWQHPRGSVVIKAMATLATPSTEKALLSGKAVLPQPQLPPGVVAMKKLGRYTIEVTSNRDRGYDARAYTVLLKEEGLECVASCNGVNPEQAMALAEAKVAVLKEEQKELRKANKGRRALSDGELESREAARNERDYV